MGKTKDTLVVYTLSTVMSSADRERGYVLGSRTIGLLKGIAFTPDKVREIAQNFSREVSLDISEQAIITEIYAALNANSNTSLQDGRSLNAAEFN